MKKNSESNVIYTLILFVSFLFVGSCSKPKLVYFSPSMVHSKSLSEHTMENQQVKTEVDSTLPVFVQQNGAIKTYSFKQMHRTINPRVDRRTNIQFKKTTSIESPKWKKAQNNRFLTMYIGLGIIAVAGLLILILVNTPSLKGDDGCIIFFVLLLLALFGLLSTITGLVIGLLN